MVDTMAHGSYIPLCNIIDTVIGHGAGTHEIECRYVGGRGDGCE